MRKINTENFYILKTKGLVASFINTLQKVHESIPSNCYKYTKIGDEFSFSRLYTKKYKYKDYAVFSILEWQPINVKPHCIKLMINYIDGAEALEEFVASN